MSANGGGENVSYTTKELLAEIREGIAVIKETTRDHGQRISSLEREVAEIDAVRKEYVPKIDSLIYSLDVKSEVSAALEARADRGFTRRERVLALLFAAVTVVMNLLALGPDLF